MTATSHVEYGRTILQRTRWKCARPVPYKLQRPALRLRDVRLAAAPFRSPQGGSRQGPAPGGICLKKLGFAKAPDGSPQQAIDKALSEYAPGRLVVINKETYRSGGWSPMSFPRSMTALRPCLPRQRNSYIATIAALFASLARQSDYWSTCARAVPCGAPSRGCGSHGLLGPMGRVLIVGPRSAFRRLASKSSSPPAVAPSHFRCQAGAVEDSAGPASVVGNRPVGRAQHDLPPLSGSGLVQGLRSRRQFYYCHSDAVFGRRGIWH